MGDPRPAGELGMRLARKASGFTRAMQARMVCELVPGRHQGEGCESCRLFITRLTPVSEILSDLDIEVPTIRVHRHPDCGCGMWPSHHFRRLRAHPDLGWPRRRVGGRSGPSHATSVERTRLRDPLEESMSEVFVRPTRYEVTVWPGELGSINRSLYCVYVEWRGGENWCVTDGFGCYRADGSREYEPIPSSREDDFITRTRFPLEEALELAKRVAPTKTINDMTAAECWEWEQTR